MPCSEEFGPLTTIPDHEFPSVVEKFIGFNFEHNSSLTNVADLIAWNEAHADIAMPKRTKPPSPHPGATH